MKSSKRDGLTVHSQIVTKTITIKYEELIQLNFSCKNFLCFNKHYWQFNTVSVRKKKQ